MDIDDRVVFGAELAGMRTLAGLRRPKVAVRAEELTGAFVLWGLFGERGEARLEPGVDVSLPVLVGELAASPARDGDEVLLRGVAASFAGREDELAAVGAVAETAGTHVLMGRELDDSVTDPDGLEVLVAEDETGLRELRRVVQEVYTGDSADRDPEADFYHAPDAMTYLAVCDDGQVLSTGSLLIADGVANIWSIATLPAARGRGAASAVVRAACAQARRQGAVAAGLRTSEELARDGGLYAALGFRVVGREQTWQVGGLRR